MKKALLLPCLVLLCAACTKDLIPSNDKTLEGQTVQMPNVSGSAAKLFVLNEGGMGSNNSTLDFLRFSDGNYVTGAFRKMNPDVAAGLGDVGNDIAVNGNEVWIVVNNSGIVEVISAIDETEIAAIPVPTPRNIAFDSKYAYVTSWAGAFASGSYDSSGYYVITDSKNPKGVVYRIDLKSKKVDGSVEVGYQPEGIACYGGKLYVANSGGISSQLPPNYAYDNTVSIIDTKSFSVTQTVTVEVNLKNVWSDGKGAIYVSTLGNYWDVHSGLYVLPVSNPADVRLCCQYVSCAAISGNTIYTVGTDTEFDWNTYPKTYSVSSYTVNNYSTGSGNFKQYDAKLSGTPYGMAVLETGYAPLLIVGDAGDYFNPGTVYCCDVDGDRFWSVTAGVCPGHFAIW